MVLWVLLVGILLRFVFSFVFILFNVSLGFFPFVFMAFFLSSFVYFARRGSTPRRSWWAGLV